MGGKKKLTLKQSEKMQERQAKKQSGTGKGGKSGAGGGGAEKKAPGVVPPDLRSEKTVGEIKKLKVLTPYAVASRFDLRLSVARDVLEELQQKGVIQYVSGSRNLKIYKPLD